jgi:hypothetical protein
MTALHVVAARTRVDRLIAQWLDALDGDDDDRRRAIVLELAEATADYIAELTRLAAIAPFISRRPQPAPPRTPDAGTVNGAPATVTPWPPPPLTPTSTPTSRPTP